MARLQELLVLAVVVCSVSAYSLKGLEELVRAMEALDEKEHIQQALVESEKREIWRVSEITDTSALVHLQKNTDQENGYWMLQIIGLDGSEPSDWEDTRTEFHHWKDPEVSQDVVIGGRERSIGGLVRLTGLDPGTSYNLRTLYSPNANGDPFVVEPVTGLRKFTTNTASKKRVVDAPADAQEHETVDNSLLKRLLEMLSQDN